MLIYNCPRGQNEKIIGVPSRDGRNGGIIMKKKNCGESKVVNFGAGKAFDSFGRATSFWTGVITYRWDARKQAFHVCTVQALGTGTAVNSRSYEEEVKSCEEVIDFLDYLRELEDHYKKVYGE